MRETATRPGIHIRGPGKRLIAIIVALCLLLILTVPVLANAVRINDAAGILDRNQVARAASSLNYPVDIYTTTARQFSGTAAQFDQQTIQKVRNNPDLIVIAISDNLKHMYIAHGTNVPLSAGSANAAYIAFRDSYANGGYTQATLSSLRSLQTSLGSASSHNPAPAPAGGGFNFAWCLVGLLVLGAIAYMVLRRRPGLAPAYTPPGGGARPGQFYSPETPLANYPATPPFGAGGYRQRQGMNPWAAGGLGAAAGGLLGYGLGRQASEREATDRERNYDGDIYGSGAGGGFGSSGSGGDFGGDGSGGDFGSSGSGGDFGGGGSGGDFGGDGSGGDFGSSGSGGDFGSSGSGRGRDF